MFLTFNSLLQKSRVLQILNIKTKTPIGQKSQVQLKRRSNIKPKCLFWLMSILLEKLGSTHHHPQLLQLQQSELTCQTKAQLNQNKFEYKSNTQTKFKLTKPKNAKVKSSRNISAI